MGKSWKKEKGRGSYALLNSRCRYSKINGRTRWTKFVLDPPIVSEIFVPTKFENCNGKRRDSCRGWKKTRGLGRVQLLYHLLFRYLSRSGLQIEYLSLISAAPSRLGSDSIEQKIRTETENLEGCVISTEVKIPCYKWSFIRRPQLIRRGIF